MTVSFELLQSLGVLAHGRRPVFENQEGGDGRLRAPNGPPSSVGDGVALNGAVLAQVVVALRANAAKWSAQVQVDGSDDGSYVVRLNQSPPATPAVNFIFAASGHTVAQIADGLATLIAANPDYECVSDGIDTITIECLLPEVSPRLALEAPLGNLEALRVDGRSCDFRIWLLPRGRSEWVRVTNHHVSSSQMPHNLWHIQTHNYGERFVVAGYDRLYIEVVTLDGECVLLVGPCMEE